MMLYHSCGGGAGNDSEDAESGAATKPMKTPVSAKGSSSIISAVNDSVVTAKGSKKGKKP